MMVISWCQPVRPRLNPTPVLIWSTYWPVIFTSFILHFGDKFILHLNDFFILFIFHLLAMNKNDSYSTETVFLHGLHACVVLIYGTTNIISFGCEKSLSYIGSW